MTTLTVFVPITGYFDDLEPGTALVGSLSPSGEAVVVDYAGRAGLTHGTYVDRLAIAADRHLTGYPTTARTVTPRQHIRKVGEYIVAPETDRPAQRTFLITDQATLDGWLAGTSAPRDGHEVDDRLAVPRRYVVTAERARFAVVAHSPSDALATLDQQQGMVLSDGLLFTGYQAATAVPTPDVPADADLADHVMVCGTCQR